MIDNLDDQFSSTDIKVTNDIKQFLITAGKWAKFLAIVTYVMCGIIVIAGFIMLISASQMSFLSTQYYVMGFVYIAMAVLYVFMGLYLFRFGKNAITGCENSKQGDFKYAMESLKSFFKFIGIVTIVVLSLYILFIVLGVGALAMMR